jgi:hypothetical protein
MRVPSIIDLMRTFVDEYLEVDIRSLSLTTKCLTMKRFTEMFTEVNSKYWEA